MKPEKPILKKPTSYCDYVAGLPLDNLHRIYHDTAYGFALADDNELFGRLILEINQAGLSWNTILNKHENFRQAFAGFQIKKIAKFDEVDQTRLLADAGIIRNRLKIVAVIHNAQAILQLQKKHGSFKSWLDQQTFSTLDEWTKLFRQTFKFTGPEIVNEFLVSTGYLPGAHIESCPIAQVIRKL